MSILLNGVTDLPRGKIASVVTFMEWSGETPVPPALAPGLKIEIQRPIEPFAYRSLYSRIGQDLFWMSRAAMSDATLAELLNRPTTVVKFLFREGRPVGMAELDRSRPGETEIVSFGVIPDEIGGGASHGLMQAVIADEIANGIARLWLHTCTLDHPAAVRFYMRHGFRGYKFAVEVTDDPRLTGDLPEHAAPQVPLLRP
jgi:GNAT superfamily N-acetyltransferase